MKDVLVLTALFVIVVSVVALRQYIIGWLLTKLVGFVKGIIARFTKNTGDKNI